MDAYLQRLQDAIASAALGMTAEDLTRHPEGRWSTAQVLEHLYLTYTGTVWKEKDAVANFRMAECYEKLDQPDQAIPHYQEYLKILPEGPFAKEARKALEKLKARSEERNLGEGPVQALSLPQP